MIFWYGNSLVAIAFVFNQVSTAEGKTYQDGTQANGPEVLTELHAFIDQRVSELVSVDGAVYFAELHKELEVVGIFEYLASG